MADDLEDKDSKTEEPTAKKLEQAIEQGQVITSKEVNNFVLLFTLTLLFILFIPFVGEKFALYLQSLIEHSVEIAINPSSVGRVLVSSMNKLFFYLSPIFIIFIAVIIFSSFMQRGHLVFAPDLIAPKLERISLIKGIGRLFSAKSLAEFIKGLLKVSLIGVIIYVVVYDDVKVMALYPDLSTGDILKQLYKVIKDMLLSVCIMMFIIAGADFFYQRYEYFKSLMMSRQDLKEEYKQTEGNPEVKKKRRSLQMNRAQRQMMSNVPKADVIITNPTHYSIALEYKSDYMPAPILIGKGLDNVAFKIREVAEQHDIPIVENAPLARALYKVNLNQEIPIEHYEAVAKIISYIYKLKKKSL